jgi:hypothetical protein
LVQEFSYSSVTVVNKLIGGGNAARKVKIRKCNFAVFFRPLLAVPALWPGGGTAVQRWR